MMQKHCGRKLAKGRREVRERFKSQSQQPLVAWHSWTVAQASSVSLSINVHRIAAGTDVAERVFAKGAQKERERHTWTGKVVGHSGFSLRARLIEFLA